MWFQVRVQVKGEEGGNGRARCTPGPWVKGVRGFGPRVQHPCATCPGQASGSDRSLAASRGPIAPFGSVVGFGSPGHIRPGAPTPQSHLDYSLALVLLPGPVGAQEAVSGSPRRAGLGAGPPSFAASAARP